MPIAIYKVGGCVRDELMGLEPQDVDYCVVGATPDEMVNLGYQSIEAAFPIFIHPSTGDEYALARKERKNDKGGYNGFDVEFDTSITLEDDLYRRDLTINAIAQDDHGNIVDPYDGCSDIENQIIRHVSEHFAEDPVRALRVARFRARWGDSWTVHEDTVTLIKQMHANGEFDNLTRERVWKELSRAMMEPHAKLFLTSLYDWGILRAVFGGKVHGPLDTGEFMSYKFEMLEIACEQNASLPVRLLTGGLNSTDLQHVKADSDIVKFANQMYTAMIYVYNLDAGMSAVAALESVNAYQNDKNRTWFLETVRTIVSKEVSILFEKWWEITKDINFDSLNDEQRADMPSMYGTHIKRNRGRAIDEWCEQAVETIRDDMPVMVDIVERAKHS